MAALIPDAANRAEKITGATLTAFIRFNRRSLVSPGTGVNGVEFFRAGPRRLIFGGKLHIDFLELGDSGLLICPLGTADIFLQRLTGEVFVQAGQDEIELYPVSGTGKSAEHRGIGNRAANFF